MLIDGPIVIVDAIYVFYESFKNRRGWRYRVIDQKWSAEVDS